MTEFQNMKDLVKKLSNRPRNDFIYDRTDTMSIVSVQSSIFDLESSMTSCEFEELKDDSPSYESKKYVLPFKTRPLKFKNKKPDNWLYSNPHADTIIERSENPIEWMRTVFDDDYTMMASKCNLKQQLSKSQGNLSCTIDFDIPDFTEGTSPVLVSHKSVSDLKNISLDTCDNLYDSRSNMVLSKTAPGSTENIVDTRSSFQDFIALAKKQEESLKAEVMRRKLEISKSPKAAMPSMKYIKNGHLSTTRNRFGFGGEKSITDASRSKSVSTKYSKVEVNSGKEVSCNMSRFSLQTFDSTKKAPQRSRYNIVNQSHVRPSTVGKTVKLYHI